MPSPMARRLRTTPTDAEQRLWTRLRKRQCAGFRFRRQVPLGPYVGDFTCLSEKLVVEVDGGQHSLQREQDDKRTEWLKQNGFRVIRFWNNDVLANTDGVVQAIALALQKSPSG